MIQNFLTNRERASRSWRAWLFLSLFAFLLLFANSNLANAQEALGAKTSKSMPAIEQILRLELTPSLKDSGGEIFNSSLSEDADQQTSTDGSRVAMFRLYNKWTGEHFYTSSKSERDKIVKAGWTYEKIEWYAPTSEDAKSVYRLYNKYVDGGDHHYTTDADEKDKCVKEGWTYEGEGWRTVELSTSAETDAVSVLRQYNPYAQTGTHNYTTDEKEQEELIKRGWKAEGVGWGGYSKLEPSTPTPTATFTVTFNSNGGSAVAPQTVQSGKTATKPIDPTKTGYTFDGWYSDSALTKSFDFTTQITANITLYAKWKDDSVEAYQVTFNSNGGSAVASQTVENGKTVTRPDNPTRSGYEFEGWYKDSTFKTPYDFSTPVTWIYGNFTLYAKWVEHISGTTLAFVVYSEDDCSLNFYKREKLPNVGDEFDGRTCTNVYVIDEKNDRWGMPFWVIDYSSEVKIVNIADEGIKPVSMYAWFHGYTPRYSLETTGKIEQFVGLERIDTSQCKDMSDLFYGQTSVAKIDGVSEWDTSNVTEMRGVFGRCWEVAELDVSKWDTSSVSNMHFMFSGCSSLTSLDLSKWDTSSVHSMRYMLSGCSSLTSLDLSKWDTSNVTDMCGMFYDCRNSTKFDVSEWDTSNVTDMSSMFGFCSALTELDLSNWDTSSLTDMYGMFRFCSVLIKLDVSKWDTSNVTCMNYVFEGCLSLTADCSNWNVAKVMNHSDFSKNAKAVTEPTWVS